MRGDNTRTVAPVNLSGTCQPARGRDTRLSTIWASDHEAKSISIIPGPFEQNVSDQRARQLIGQTSLLGYHKQSRRNVGAYDRFLYICSPGLSAGAPIYTTLDNGVADT